jgi:hypothetical protein
MAPIMPMSPVKPTVPAVSCWEAPVDWDADPPVLVWEGLEVLWEAPLVDPAGAEVVEPPAGGAVVDVPPGAPVETGMDL